MMPHNYIFRDSAIQSCQMIGEHRTLARRGDYEGLFQSVSNFLEKSVEHYQGRLSMQKDLEQKALKGCKQSFDKALFYASWYGQPADQKKEAAQINMFNNYRCETFLLASAENLKALEVLQDHPISWKDLSEPFFIEVMIKFFPSKTKSIVEQARKVPPVYYNLYGHQAKKFVEMHDYIANFKPQPLSGIRKLLGLSPRHQDYKI